MISRCIKCGCILTDPVAKEKKLCPEHTEKSEFVGILESRIKELEEQVKELTVAEKEWKYYEPLFKFFKNFKGTNFIELIKSFINSHYLVTFPGGKSHCSDIDSYIHKNGYFIFFEVKTFWCDQIEIKIPQFSALWEFYTQLKRRDIIIIGVGSNDQLDGDDYIWYVSLGEILEKEKKHDGEIHVRIHRDQMKKITRKEFSWYMKRELDLKSDPYYDPKEDALKKFKDLR